MKSIKLEKIRKPVLIGLLILNIIAIVLDSLQVALVLQAIILLFNNLVLKELEEKEVNDYEFKLIIPSQNKSLKYFQIIEAFSIPLAFYILKLILHPYLKLPTEYDSKIFLLLYLGIYFWLDRIYCGVNFTGFIKFYENELTIESIKLKLPYNQIKGFEVVDRVIQEVLVIHPISGTSIYLDFEIYYTQGKSKKEILDFLHFKTGITVNGINTLKTQML